MRLWNPHIGIILLLSPTFFRLLVSYGMPLAVCGQYAHNKHCWAMRIFTNSVAISFKIKVTLGLDL